MRSATGTVIPLPISFSHLYLSSTPQGLGSYHTVEQLTQLHGSHTPAPSLWPGRELRKYHYPLHLLLPPPGAARFPSYKCYRSPHFSGSWRTYDLGSVLRPAQVTCVINEYSIFKDHERFDFFCFSCPSPIYSFGAIWGGVFTFFLKNLFIFLFEADMHSLIDVQSTPSIAAISRQERPS